MGYILPPPAELLASTRGKDVTQRIGDVIRVLYNEFKLLERAAALLRK